jgi:hypothetical protein
MTYYDRLHSWCIVRCLPNAQTLTVQRFRRRNEAEEHLRVLRRLEPDGIFEIVFDPGSDPLNCDSLHSEGCTTERFNPLPSFHIPNLLSLAANKPLNRSHLLPEREAVPSE